MFVSSTLEELRAERAAARQAIEDLRFVPVLFELGARPHPPRALYRAYLEQSQVFVGVYWERYGWVAPGKEISGIEDECLCAEGMPKLVYLKRPAHERDPRLQHMLDGVVADAVSYRSFETPDELAGYLRDDLALLVSERFTDRPSAAPPQIAIPTPASSFIGREDEVASVAELLRRPDVRLVTLVGAGGIGKTRLGFDAARRAAEGLADGAVTVRLASLVGADEVLPAIAEALGISSPDSPTAASVRAHLAAREMLLVLDNMEHVLGAAPAVADLLASAPGLRILATSRTRLDISGEHCHRVSPLELPAADACGPDAIRRSDAVRLFTTRAEAAGWTTDDADLEIVSAIVRSLDGLPLAIELAAAQARVVPPELVHTRVRRRLDLAGGPRDADPRHRTLRDAITWSYDLLDERSRRLFQALSVFSGGFTVEAVAAVAGTEHDPFELLASLVDSSLVVPAPLPRMGVRFEMLGTIGEYAAECLDGGGAREIALDRHLAYFAQLADEAYDAPAERRLTTRLRLDGERENLRVAYWNAMTAHPAEAVRLAGALGVFFSRRGLLAEGRVAIARALDAAPDAPAVWRARALLHGGWLAAEQDECDEADRMAGEALELYRSLGDERGIGGSLNTLGYSASTRGDHEHAIGLYEGACRAFAAAEPDFLRLYAAVNLAATRVSLGDLDEARRLYSEALEYFDADGFEDEAATVRFRLGELAEDQGDPAAARRWFRSSAEVARRVGNPRLLGWALMHLAHVDAGGGRTGDATRSYSEALQIHLEVGDRPGMAYCFERVASVALSRGKADVAADLLVGARALREASKTPIPEHDRGEVLETEDRVRAALGDGRLEYASDGTSLEIAALVALARDALVQDALAD